MKVRALRQFSGTEGMVRPRQIIDVPDRRANELISRNLVEPLEGRAAVAAPSNKMVPASQPGTAAATTSKTSPTSAGPAGGQTGQAKKSSSSAPARARKK